MSKNLNPPFRADHVGSLLRPAAVLEARRHFKLGNISAAELRAVEDEAIAKAVKQVEATGIQSITDGEFRREFFHLDFLEKLDGVTVSCPYLPAVAAWWPPSLFRETVA